MQPEPCGWLVSSELRLTLHFSHAMPDVRGCRRFNLHHGVYIVGRINVHVSAGGLYPPRSKPSAPPPRATVLHPVRSTAFPDPPRPPPGRVAASPCAQAAHAQAVEKAEAAASRVIRGETKRLLASVEHILGPTQGDAAESSVSSRVRGKLRTAVAGLCDAGIGGSAAQWLGLDDPVLARPAGAFARSQAGLVDEALFSGDRPRATEPRLVPRKPTHAGLAMPGVRPASDSDPSWKVFDDYLQRSSMPRFR